MIGSFFLKNIFSFVQIAVFTAVFKFTDIAPSVPSILLLNLCTDISVILFFRSNIYIWFFFTVYFMRLFFHFFKDFYDCIFKDFYDDCFKVLTDKSNISVTLMLSSIEFFLCVYELWLLV